MSNINIKDIEKELNKRLYYQDKEDEEKYNSDREKINDKYPDEGFRSVQVDSPNGGELNRLEQKKHWDIRKKLNDDEGFEKIKEKLSDIEHMITQKEDELELLTGPKSSHVFQRAYTMVTGKKNTADIAKENFDNKKKGLDSELNTLKTIKTNIQKLIPIYKVEKLSDLYNSPTIVVKNAPDVKTSEALNKPIKNKRGVMVSAENMVVGRTYKLHPWKDDIFTLTNKGPFTTPSGPYDRDTTGAITFSNGETYNVYPNEMYEEVAQEGVAQEGGKRKTRRQRKSRKVRRRQTKRRR